MSHHACVKMGHVASWKVLKEMSQQARVKHLSASIRFNFCLARAVVCDKTAAPFQKKKSRAVPTGERKRQVARISPGGAEEGKRKSGTETTDDGARVEGETVSVERKWEVGG